MRLSFCLLAVLLVAGCDSGSDSTYPAAGAFPEIEVAALAQAQPGQYNVAAYVSDVVPCPVNQNCGSDGTIELAASNTVQPPTNSPRVPVDAPGQFVRGERYLFSVRVVAAPRVMGPDDPVNTSLLLIGYDRL